jgi:hypothetical protein
MHDGVTMPYDADPRRAWKQWRKAHDQWHQRWIQFLQDREPLPVNSRALTKALLARHAAEQALLAQEPPFPEQCRGLTCGAQTRLGSPCQRRGLYGPNTRCRLHGGLSTGPTSPEGKRRSAANGLRPKRKRTS